MGGGATGALTLPPLGRKSFGWWRSLAIVRDFGTNSLHDQSCSNDGVKELIRKCRLRKRDCSQATTVHWGQHLGANFLELVHCLVRCFLWNTGETCVESAQDSMDPLDSSDFLSVPHGVDDARVTTRSQYDKALVSHMDHQGLIVDSGLVINEVAVSLEEHASGPGSDGDRGLEIGNAVDLPGHERTGGDLRWRACVNQDATTLLNVVGVQSSVNAHRDVACVINKVFGQKGVMMNSDRQRSLAGGQDRYEAPKMIGVTVADNQVLQLID
jgi:hypothetical protein